MDPPTNDNSSKEKDTLGQFPQKNEKTSTEHITEQESVSFAESIRQFIDDNYSDSYDGLFPKSNSNEDVW